MYMQPVDDYTLTLKKRDTGETVLSAYKIVSPGSQGLIYDATGQGRFGWIVPLTVKLAIIGRSEEQQHTLHIADLVLYNRCPHFTCAYAYITEQVTSTGYTCDVIVMDRFDTDLARFAKGHEDLQYHIPAITLQLLMAVYALSQIYLAQHDMHGFNVLLRLNQGEDACRLRRRMCYTHYEIWQSKYTFFASGVKLVERKLCDVYLLNTGVMAALADFGQMGTGCNHSQSLIYAMESVLGVVVINTSSGRPELISIREAIQALPTSKSPPELMQQFFESIPAPYALVDRRPAHAHRIRNSTSRDQPHVRLTKRDNEHAHQQTRKQCIITRAVHVDSHRWSCASRLRLLALTRNLWYIHYAIEKVRAAIPPPFMRIQSLALVRMYFVAERMTSVPDTSSTSSRLRFLLPPFVTSSTCAVRAVTDSHHFANAASAIAGSAARNNQFEDVIVVAESLTRLLGSCMSLLLKQRSLSRPFRRAGAMRHRSQLCVTVGLLVCYLPWLGFRALSRASQHDMAEEQKDAGADEDKDQRFANVLVELVSLDVAPHPAVIEGARRWCQKLATPALEAARKQLAAEGEEIVKERAASVSKEKKFEEAQRELEGEKRKLDEKHREELRKLQERHQVEKHVLLEAQEDLDGRVQTLRQSMGKLHAQGVDLNARMEAQLQADPSRRLARYLDLADALLEKDNERRQDERPPLQPVQQNQQDPAPQGLPPPVQQALQENQQPAPSPPLQENQLPALQEDHQPGLSPRPRPPPTVQQEDAAAAAAAPAPLAAQQPARLAVQQPVPLAAQQPARLAAQQLTPIQARPQQPAREGVSPSPQQQQQGAKEPEQRGPPARAEMGSPLLPGVTAAQPHALKRKRLHHVQRSWPTERESEVLQAAFEKSQPEDSAACTENCPVASHRFASRRIASHRVASRCIASHRIASLRIASHRVTSHCIASHRVTLQSPAHCHVVPPQDRVICGLARYVREEGERSITPEQLDQILHNGGVVRSSWKNWHVRLCLKKDKQGIVLKGVGDGDTPVLRKEGIGTATKYFMPKELVEWGRNFVSKHTPAPPAEEETDVEDPVDDARRARDNDDGYEDSSDEDEQERGGGRRGRTIGLADIFGPPVNRRVDDEVA
ncbi:hypothetical protein JKP88DRAFT_245860 [Tribonema minus]|uniref:Uncharacterized protein n=1 Tax=Tribonema minus TaxID=303371 RepID=A0A835YWE2_9STRA|nr:hypothetical protein JKP88DRAFT_245860 [Tribonema minus]